MGKQKKKDRSAPLPYVALVLACAIPGAGHVYLGRIKRGIILFVTITALFWSGVGIGGVMTVDSQRERWWFVAQVFTGVHGVIAWQRQRRVHDRLVSGKRLDLRDRYDQDVLDAKLQAEGLALVAPADTVARAYSGVAGLLNLMCVFDALMLSIMGVTGESPRGKDGSEQSGKARDA